MSIFLKILKTAARSGPFMETANLALDIFGSGQSFMVSEGEDSLQSSQEVARIYSIRRDINYFKKRRVSGLDETISFLYETDRDVRCIYAYSEKILISIWYKDSDQLVCGVLVIENNN